MARIFISYRRQDSGTFTGRIHDQLKANFGVNNVFRDVYDIPAGSDFRAVLNEAVGGCDVCLVIIGPQWANIADTQGKRRLDDPDDFVRIEVESALRNPKVLVVPVLVDNANMPTAEQLPESLGELAYRNAVKVRTDPDFPHDMEMLVRQLKRSKGQLPSRILRPALAAAAILLAGFFLFGIFKGLGSNIPVTPSVVPTRTEESPTPVDLTTATPLMEPVAPGEIPVLVAQIEQIGTDQRDVTRFIVDDLTQRFEIEFPVANVRIREYKNVIRSNAEALQIAEQTGAIIVIWGQYDNDDATINVQVGSLESRPSLIIDRDTLERTLNVRVKMKDEREETLAYQVLSMLAFLHTAENDFVETMRLIMALDQLNAPSPEAVGNSVAAHMHRASQAFLPDRQLAVEEATQAIELDAANPLLYIFRGLTYQGMGNFALSNQDADTALRLAPEDWIIPYYLKGMESMMSNDLAGGIEAHTRIIEKRPDDWMPYNQRGYMYFRAQKYEEARTDIDRSITLKPEMEWPYMWATLIALRQGRIDDASAQMKNILGGGSNPVFVERLFAAMYGVENAKLLGASMAAIGHLSFGQYAVAVQDADMVLAAMPTYAEMHLLKGVSYCNLGDYENAQDAYSQGLAVDPSFTLLHFLRAEVRGKLGNMNGAAEDLAVVPQSDLYENLKDYLAAAQSGQFSCKQLIPAR
jgi:Flp pilus assembly protein TadD